MTRGVTIAVVVLVVAFLAVAMWWAVSGGDDAPRPGPTVVAPDARR